ncbi:hypothetical protein [Mucilaginibacter agri]|uniref:Uncharacterized protein n=1 Tax=Mucilaginibacter agri TaxID=2695265 RepID=A0A966DUM3_9SPHI|nr:hypothetical protein [Mucilaginibacter agri]NCD71905.1 hypothetical protein [Mucilaginibacter agri]
MGSPLTNVLNKIFVIGFYRAHAGILLFIFLVLFGAVPGDMLLSYHKALMIAFLTSPLLFSVVFVVWLLYLFKTWHYMAGQLSAPHHQFLFYSISAYSLRSQFLGWLVVQFNMLLPVIVYSAITVSVGLANHCYLASAGIALYLLLLCIAGALFCIKLTHTLPEGNKLSLLLRFGHSIPKPYFSLFILHIFNQKKLTYVIIKGISWLIITAVFALFADVKHDARVAGIAVLAIVVAHVAIVFEERVFEETFLRFGRNLPYSRWTLFGGFIMVYLIMLLPEIIWLYNRFDPLFATQLMVFGLSCIILFHSLLYRIGLAMDIYMQWVLGLFMLIFWIVMFKAMLFAAALCLTAAFALFYYNYYKSFAVLPEDEK